MRFGLTACQKWFRPVPNSFVEPAQAPRPGPSAAGSVKGVLSRLGVKALEHSLTALIGSDAEES
jgi:hypothetical protein